MSGPPSNSDYSFASGGPQAPHSATSDSRLLDAAETLVTLQSRGGSRGRSAEEAKSRSVYLTPQPQSYKMPPQPPTSSGTNPTSMGPPPPPPPSSNNVTFVLIDQCPSQQQQQVKLYFFCMINVPRFRIVINVFSFHHRRL